MREEQEPDRDEFSFSNYPTVNDDYINKLCSKTRAAGWSFQNFLSKLKSLFVTIPNFMVKRLGKYKKIMYQEYRCDE